MNENYAQIMLKIIKIIMCFLVENIFFCRIMDKEKHLLMHFNTPRIVVKIHLLRFYFDANLIWEVLLQIINAP